MDSTIDLTDPSEALDLNNIRYQLIRLEDTITFHIIERVQFPLNETIYKVGGVKVPDPNLSLSGWILKETEQIHARLRRYQAPDEYPFFPEYLYSPVMLPLDYPKVLHPNTVNVNKDIMDKYIHQILPLACRTGPDRGAARENYGSSAVCDVGLLQALSRRIHFGKFVAEAKFRSETERFVDLILKEDRQGIDEAITNAAVEAQVLQRLRLKATTYGIDPASQDDKAPRINVDAVVAMYKEVVIPLTKIVEVEYLMQRLQNTQWDPTKSQ